MHAHLTDDLHFARRYAEGWEVLGRNFGSSALHPPPPLCQEDGKMILGFHVLLPVKVAFPS